MKSAEAVDRRKLWAQAASVENYRHHPWFDGKSFSSDWTTHGVMHWPRILTDRRDEPVKILEVGSYEGRSAVFFLNFFPRGTLVCIDPFSVTPPEVEKRFDENVAEFGERVRKIKARSIPALDELMMQGETFDIIYIDGDHHRDVVMVDSTLAWPLLRRNGVLIWDDYEWRHATTPAEHPKDAIDAFLRMHEGELTLLLKAYQVIVRRL